MMMKQLTFLLSLIFLCIETAIIQNNNYLLAQNNYEALYRNFIIQSNRQKILAQNNKNLPFLLESNKFIQYSQEQFINLFLALRVPNQTEVVGINNQISTIYSSQNNQNNIQSNGIVFVTSEIIDINWTLSGAVTSIKNQGGCGGCWAFAAISDLESSYLLNGYSNSIDLSQQQLIDCAGGYYNYGCGGGWMTNAFAYINKNPITTQSSYPYTARTQSCQSTAGNFSLKNLRSYWKNQNCQLLVDILKTRPVSVAVAADPLYWGFYKSGVLSYCPGTINHGVVVTGVKQSLNQNYWIVKNSWGTDWGENGYIRIDNSQNNLCDICSYPQHSIL